MLLKGYAMIKFQKLQAPYIPQILDMMVDFYAIDNYSINPEISKRNFELLLENPSYGQAFLIQDGEVIHGYLLLSYVFSFEFQGRVAILDELYLASSARGKGLGKAAVEYAQEYAREIGCTKMFLEVEPHNERAQLLYKKLGFDFHSRQIMSYSIHSTK